eukprot:6585064-Alexandrium_andersonii.AAC.1
MEVECLAHRRKCPVYPQSCCHGPHSVDQPRPTVVAFAGVTCNGWSRHGAGLKFCHPSEEAHNAWIAERIARAEQGVEDFVFVECVEGYHIAEKFVAPLAATHYCITVEVGPEVFGHPHRRPRVFGFAANRATTAYAGPENPTSDFLSRFQRARILNGDIYFTAPDEERFLEYRNLAIAQTNHLDSDILSQLDGADLVAALLPQGCST